jgi:hypothetical protein
LQMQELARYRDQSNPLNDTIHKAGRPRLCSILYTAIAAPTSIGRIRNDFGHSKEKWPFFHPGALEMMYLYIMASSTRAWKDVFKHVIVHCNIAPLSAGE